LALALAGCASSGKSKPDDAAGATGGTGSDWDDGSRGASGSTMGDANALEAVYFDYDKSEIRSDAAATLRENAQVIKSNPGWGEVVIQGNTDERGTEEYNLALGERRAVAVKRYLQDLGVESTRLRTVSFGEAKPAVPGHDESAWRYNRRSDFVAR
jgi:peptidoglycan-associated lipoprotein